MNRFRVGVAILSLALPSYAWSAPAEAELGAPMPALSGAPSTVRPSLRLPSLGSFKENARMAGALTGLKSDAPSATRGANEARVFKAASPAVVLIVTDTELGSGAVIGADGLIVTNLHVVGGSKTVGVIFKPAKDVDDIGKAEVHRAKVIKKDEIADLALIQVVDMPANTPVLKIAGSNVVEVGSDVHAIGHPTGEGWTYTRGIVSQIRKDYTWRYDGDQVHTATVIQTQTPISPGNSGGPLLDDNLDVVGINSFTEDGEGLHFAVSGEDIQAFLARKRSRLTPRKVKAQAEKACEAKTIASERSKKPVGNLEGIDTDCDGKVDIMMMTPDDKKLGLLYMLDADRDGKIDTLIADDDRDGNLDGALYDTDGDGKADLCGYFKPGETEPYRWEKCKG